MACVPTERVVGPVSVALPPDTVADAPAVEIATPPSKSCAIPPGVPPVTVTLNVKAVPELSLSLGLVTVIWVVVATGGLVPPPLTPLHPRVMPRRHTRPSPSAARYFLRPPGRNIRKMAAKPVPALRAHQPLPPIEGGAVCVGGISFASYMRSSRSREAVWPVEVAVTWQFKVLATGFAAVMLMFSGEFGQVTPGGREAAVAVSVTWPVKPPEGVTVTVSGAAAPVVELRINGFGL